MELQFKQKLAILLLVLAVGTTMFTALFVFVFMHSETVEPGYELVINDRPMIFGSGGVREETVKAGRVWMFRTSTAEPVRVTPQSFTLAVDDFMSKDNIPLDFETTIQYQIVDARTLVTQFGAGWFDNNVKNQYLSLVRSLVKEVTMSELMSSASIADELDTAITTKLKALVITSKLPILVHNVSLGRAKPNAEVLVQMDATAAQQQRTKTLVEATTAENQRELEQIAKAKADNAYRKAMNMSPEMFLQLQAIIRYSEACATSTCVIGVGGTVPPVVLGHK